MKRRPDPDPSADGAIDAEVLARLLDGALDERERDDLLARLAGDSEAQAVLADAAAALESLDAGPASDLIVGVEVEPGVSRAGADLTRGGLEAGEGVDEGGRGASPTEPVPFARPKARRAGGWLALAAVLALLSVVPWMVLRDRAPVVDGPSGMVALLDERHQGLPRGWDPDPWPVRRAAERALSEEARGARVGARLVALEVAHHAGDVESIARFAADIAALLEPVPAASPAARLYREIAARAGEGPVAMGPLVERGESGVLALLGEPVVLGAAAEAVRVAALRRDAGFFRDAGVRALFSSRFPARLPPAADSARAGIHAAFGRMDLDWDALVADAHALLRALGG
jgi:hypothetical protein